MSETRRDFKQWQIDLVYEEQEGCCTRCGAGLEQTGFHRHHKDGDHANNSLSNLELLCPRCHHSLSGLTNPYTQHKEKEAFVLEKAMNIVESILSPQTVEVTDAKGNKSTKVLELSGVVLDKLTDTLSMILSVSRNVNEVDYGREFTPSSIKLMRKSSEAEIQAQAYMDGYLEGIKKALSGIVLKQQEMKE